MIQAKEKAKELISKFIDHVPNIYYFEHQKQCALITVNEILKSWEDDGNKSLDEGIIHWWNKVKKEIENL